MPRSGDSKEEECRMPFIGPLKGGENAACLVPETLKVKNVAYLLSDHSRALAQAYILKKARRHSFLESTKIRSGVLFYKPKKSSYSFLVK